MVDKLHAYQGPVGQMHSIRDRVKSNFDNWSEKRESVTFPDIVRKFAVSRGEIVEELPTQPQCSKFTRQYTHMYRKKTLFELIRLSLSVMGIEFTYAAITAFAAPMLLTNGASRSTTTMSWILSSAIGFFLSPILGSISDQCKLNYGRRRPFIILLSILSVFGLLVIANKEWVTSLFADESIRIETNSTSFNSVFLDNKSDKFYTWTIGIVIFGLALCDFSSDALQSFSRAYLMDVCTSEEETRGLSMYTVLAGYGGTVGYFLGFIDWGKDSIGDRSSKFGNQINVLFTIIAILFTICMVTTVTTFPEIPLEQIQHFQLKSITEYNCDTEHSENTLETDDLPSSVAACTSKTYRDYQEEDNDDMLEVQPTLINYLMSIVRMPNSLRILYFTNFLCWMSHVSYSLYFTEFVGETVFEGDPKSQVDSNRYRAYYEGVRFGCLGMSIYSLSCVVNSIVVEFLINRFGLRTVYLVNVMTDAIAQFLLYLFHNQVCVIACSWASGVLYSTIFTMPYLLLAQYHTQNVFEVDNAGNPVVSRQIRGMGTDIAIIGSCVFSAQFILSILMGELIEIFSFSVVPLISSVVAAFAAYTTTKLLYLK